MITVLAIAIVDQIPAVTLRQHAFFDIGDISDYLSHPPLMWVQSDTCDVHLACAQMNEEKHVVGDQSEARPYLRGEEIGRHQHIHMIANELSPG